MNIHKGQVQEKLAIRRLLIEQDELPMRWFNDGRHWAMAAPFMEFRSVVVNAARLLNEEVDFPTEGFPRSILEPVSRQDVPMVMANDWLEAWCHGVLSFWDEFQKQAARKKVG